MNLIYKDFHYINKKNILYYIISSGYLTYGILRGDLNGIDFWSFESSEKKYVKNESEGIAIIILWN